MGNELIDSIIQAARQMREHGHEGQLVAVCGLEVDDGGLGGVNSSYGDILVFARSGLVAPDEVRVMTEDAYFEMAIDLARRGK